MDTPFRIWRRSLGLTQIDAADMLSIDVKTVQRYEARVRPVPGPIAQLMTLAAKGVDIEVEPWPDDPNWAHEMLAEFRTDQPGRPTAGPATSGLEPPGLSTVGPQGNKPGGVLRRLLGRSEPRQPSGAPLR